MNILYTRLFNLSIKHDFYENGLAQGVNIFPSLETTKLLKGGRMLFKHTSKGVTVLYRTEDDETTPFVDLGKDVRLTFELSLNNKNQFLNITDLDESPAKKYSSSNILYFKNNPSAASINPATPEPLEFELIDFIQSRLFSYSFSLSGSPTQVLFRVFEETNNTLVSIGKDVNGNLFPDTITVSKQDNDSYSQQIDLRDRPKGKYRIEIWNSGDTTKLQEVKVYLDEDMAGKDINGIVDIIYDTAQDHIYDDVEEYAIEFSRKVSFWKYLVVNKSNNHNFNLDTFSINDAGSPTTAYVVNNFIVVGTVPSADIKVNGLDTIVFKSDAEIPFYEIPKVKLQLKKNALVKPVLGDLPNPLHSGVVKEEAGDLASEIYVFI
ncbi:hypothetical protein [Marinigracilibium pacificum]|uniref:Uncharacterized protein n=1 Tax=Marinigracilibium pacificum TaxID=2729599 RepID=A0A848J5E0_9BACT|nr:hypothetical protein [Marinigracilibium pacificum]NMM49684.1 hypothetical protein [Marinigracilibium pacificum]